MTTKAPERVSDMTEAAQVTASDLAWMAAVIDLKGLVVRKKNRMRRTPQVVLTFSSKDERIAQRLSALTGTSPEPHAAPRADGFIRRGCTEHCPEPHVHIGEDAYPWNMPTVTRWSVTGIAAAVVLLNLAPYMSTYDDYAAEVAEILGSFAATGQGSGAVRATLARLSALGWQVPAVVKVRMAEAKQEGGDAGD